MKSRCLVLCLVFYFFIFMVLSTTCEYRDTNETVECMNFGSIYMYIMRFESFYLFIFWSHMFFFFHVI